MIAFKDFVPEQTIMPGFFRKATYKNFQQTLDEANRWIAENNIQVVNIETVVLPNIDAPFEEGSTDPELGTSADVSAVWRQFIRVWHRID